MDGVSSATAIISVIETCQMVIRFIKDVVDADEDRNKIMDQIRGSVDIFFKLDDVVKKNPDRLPDLQSLLVQGGCADQYQRIVEGLIPRLTSAKD
jgi:hypothetical protein